jgi:hypothetical protein
MMRRLGDGTLLPSGGTGALEARDGSLAEEATPSLWAGLGLRRTHLADGRSVVQGRLTGRRIG